MPGEEEGDQLSNTEDRITISTKKLTFNEDGGLEEETLNEVPLWLGLG